MRKIETDLKEVPKEIEMALRKEAQILARFIRSVTITELPFDETILGHLKNIQFSRLHKGNIICAGHKNTSVIRINYESCKVIFKSTLCKNIF